MTRTPTYHPHLRLTFGGYLGYPGLPVEAWSINVSMGDPAQSGFGFTPAQSDIDDAAADFVAFIKRPASRWHGHAHFQQLSVYQVQADGKALGGGPLGIWKGDENGLAAGQTSSPSVPPQAALVVSMNKASASRRHKGRVYLPFPNVGMDVSFLLDQAQCQGIATSFAQLVTDLNNWPGVDHDGTRVVVSSTFGDLTPVTDIRVGRRWDVMRSRARSLPEAYTTAPVS